MFASPRTRQAKLGRVQVSHDPCPTPRQSTAAETVTRATPCLSFLAPRMVTRECLQLLELTSLLSPGDEHLFDKQRQM
jgi:hypothetical protein